MPTKFPLQPLLDLANTRMDEAARRLGELIASERGVQQKLELLQRYRAEYGERFREAARGGIDLNAMRNYSAFLGRLDEAIEVQRRAVEESHQHTTQGQQQWIAQRSKVRAFDTLAHRHQNTLARVALRQEQRATDEHAARRFREKNEDTER
ncbi:MAG: flagellar export protein FliJ [Azoarcus sp.]|jgi:flagellar FliJ protein|nr:flagellar export protein FliJ [Azoarcus sp.]